MRKPPRPIKLGRKERMTFSQIDIDEVSLMPNLIDIQTKSYKWFVEKGLKEAFDDISPIQDPAGTWTLEFLDYAFDDTPKYDQEECKEREATYSVRLRVQTQLINNETRAVIEQPVFMGDFPLMTEKGTFIYNGAERVVVTQLVRSPGAYYTEERDRDNNSMFFTQIIPNRGAWIEYETDDKGVLYAKLDRKHKLPLTTFVRALGVGTTREILDTFGDDPLLENTLDKERSQFGKGREDIDSYEEGLKRLYAILRPSDPATVEDARKHLDSILYDPRRYDMARVGRFKYNKKLGLSARLADQIAAEDVIDPNTGEILAEAGSVIDRDTAREIENSGIGKVDISSDDRVLRIVGNRFVDLDHYVDPAIYEDTRVEHRVYYPVLMEILEEGYDDEALAEALDRRRNDLSPRHILLDDILASVSYLLNIRYGIGHVDDIDHLGNRRLRTVGELLQNQFRIGLTRMERVVKERMGTQDAEDTTPQALINIKPVTAAVREFFGSSQLSQFMDQCNPLAELTHKRRLSALGPGGLTRERAGFDVRDVHDSHYGRMCPIETPEGPNIGLIGSLATYGVVNEYGFIESPYRKVDKGTGIVTDQIDYITADEEEMLIVAQANEELDSSGRFINRKVAARGPHGEIDLFDRNKVDYMDVSPRQVVSVATAMIPFLENDDANRALMGSNMQRQAVPLLVTEAPRVGTGMEYIAAKDSGAVVNARNAGTVTYVDATRIVIERDDGGADDEYRLIKFKRSNQQTCINQKPIVFHGEHVEAGETIADGPSTSNGEVALGKNLLIGFMTWEGYNYEDAIILNERLIMEDTLTSIHIESYETDARDTKLGPEEITRDIANLSEEALKDLDEDGIIRIGAEVKPKDILVGKVTPKGETVVTPQEKLLRAVFGEKGRDVKDTSKTVPHGESGIVVDVKVFKRENGDELPPGVNERVRCYIATKRKIQVGDKMAGRHGNKGVISKILPEEDMPFLEDGTPLQVMLNPLGVPSRMNVGQVLEVHLGLVADHKDWYVATPVFDGAREEDIIGLLKECGFSETGKMRLRDGRTGEYFDNPVTVGYMYMLKLHHLVDDKIHARSDGPYSLVTQQPLGGKAQFGGQRFGEMEVWALEAYGAAYTLQEILTVKSDDITGRVKTYEAIVKGENIPEAGMPESFKVLIKELQALCLDARILSADDREIEIRDSSNDPNIRPLGEAGVDMAEIADAEEVEDGFSVENENGEPEPLIPDDEGLTEEEQGGGRTNE